MHDRPWRDPEAHQPPPGYVPPMYALGVDGWARMLADWWSMVRLPGEPAVFDHEDVVEAAAALVVQLEERVGADQLREAIAQLRGEEVDET